MPFASYVENFPRPGEEVEGSKFSKACGGKGANQCVAALKLGARVALVGKVSLCVILMGERTVTEGVRVAG